MPYEDVPMIGLVRRVVVYECVDKLPRFVGIDRRSRRKSKSRNDRNDPDTSGLNETTRKIYLILE